ncbi:Metallo-dependent phosphatase-like protein [Aspergillus ambiguus]|uniref:Metallo-dependent phosphatase-like protein n=1 Tax=Aspergillus ambiguus TaxID=176160 RepID=UPI003CCE1DB9
MIKTRLCLISDTHTLPPNPPLTHDNPYRHPLPKADILLHAGDLTKVGRRSEHIQMLAMLQEAPAELKIVIAGNHDITLDPDYYASVGHLRHRYRTDHLAASPTLGRKPRPANDDDDPDEGPLEDPAAIRALYTGDEARAAGIAYMDEGLRTFFLSNGARLTVYASPYTPEFCRWAFAYDRAEDRFNPPPPGEVEAEAEAEANVEGPANPVPDFPAVDIMLTHGPPYGVHDRVVGSHESVGCEHLFRAVQRARPRLHVFGHIHEGYGATRWEWSTRNESLIQVDRETALEDRAAYVDVSSDAAVPLRVGDETLFVNASVVTVQYQAVNAPWVVDLDLPSKDVPE